MTPEDYTPHPLLETISAALSVIPVDPDEPIEEDGYGALTLSEAYGLIRSAAIQVAKAKRAAQGEHPELDESDDPNVTSGSDGSEGRFIVEWEYNATPWEHNNQWAEYRTTRGCERTFERNRPDGDS
jgi:hypothetical protein